VSAGPARVDLLFLWHHHQPDYRDPIRGRSRLPWVRLHATKDYLDMALHLERHPTLRATFNFVPSLIDQLDDAVAGGRDELFDLLARAPGPFTLDECRLLAFRCAMVPGHALERWPSLRTTIDAARRAASEGGGGAANDPLWLRLACGFLLAWIDPIFLGEPEAGAALAAGSRLEPRHRDELIALHARLTGYVIPAYRRLAEHGQIELSATPYFHPILPLLVDLRTARRAQPSLPLPVETLTAPGDAREQIERARVRHAAAFGAAPSGMWPSEGGVSPEVAEIAAGCGVQWLASDEGVLWRSLPEASRRRAALYRPWKLTSRAGDITLFFRDHELSDRIGFVYQRWDPEQAAEDLVQRVLRIGEEHGRDAAPLVSIMLDGENCWEGYPDDGGPFLEALYRRIESTPAIRTVTPSQVIAEGASPGTLPTLHSGSWIDADFHIWIGHPEKNRAWDLLARTRHALEAGAVTRAGHPGAWESLARAEGSDWFWWYGDDHHTPDKPLFDDLFRAHLKGAYLAAGLPVPATLEFPVARMARDTERHHRPIGFVHATIDGRRSHFYEWHAAGRVSPGAGGAMHRAPGVVRDLFYGFDGPRLVLRLDPVAKGFPAGSRLRLEIGAPVSQRIEIGPLDRARPEIRRAAGLVPDTDCRIGEVLELAIPVAALGARTGDAIELAIQVLGPDGPLETLPGDDLLRVTVPGADYESVMWSA
jgi:alpha-amylase/alpha-mannosidase (GH57 family)